MSTFWKDKRVLVTGHTGFKGSWLSHYLIENGARVIGVSLRPSTIPSLFELLNLKHRTTNYFTDISDFDEVKKIIRSNDPEFVFHLAAQAIVGVGYKRPFETVITNTLGTVNVMEASVEAESIRAIIIVTTDKVYQRSISSGSFSEQDPLGGSDPYSASKAAADILAQSFLRHRMPTGVGSAIVRAGNVVGGGDWSEYRLIPDLIRAWSRGEVLDIRMPQAVRPWQHVLEPTFGYLKIARKIYESNTPTYLGAFNIGPNDSDVLKVEQVVKLCMSFYSGSKYKVMPISKTFDESHYLSLDNSLVKATFDIEPVWKSEQTFERTMKWYLGHYSGKCSLLLCNEDIEDYEQSAQKK